MASRAGEFGAHDIFRQNVGNFALQYGCTLLQCVKRHHPTRARNPVESRILIGSPARICSSPL